MLGSNTLGLVESLDWKQFDLCIGCYYQGSVYVDVRYSGRQVQQFYVLYIDDETSLNPRQIIILRRLL